MKGMTSLMHKISVKFDHLQMKLRELEPKIIKELVSQIERIEIKILIQESNYHKEGFLSGKITPTKIDDISKDILKIITDLIIEAANKIKESKNTNDLYATYLELLKGNKECGYDTKLIDFIAKETFEELDYKDTLKKTITYIKKVDFRDFANNNKEDGKLLFCFFALIRQLQIICTKNELLNIFVEIAHQKILGNINEHLKKNTDKNNLDFLLSQSSLIANYDKNYSNYSRENFALLPKDQIDDLKERVASLLLNYVKKSPTLSPKSISAISASIIELNLGTPLHEEIINCCKNNIKFFAAIALSLKNNECKELKKEFEVSDLALKNFEKQKTPLTPFEFTRLCLAFINNKNPTSKQKIISILKNRPRQEGGNEEIYKSSILDKFYHHMVTDLLYRDLVVIVNKYYPHFWQSPEIKKQFMEKNFDIVQQIMSDQKTTNELEEMTNKFIQDTCEISKLPSFLTKFHITNKLSTYFDVGVAELMDWSGIFKTCNEIYTGYPAEYQQLIETSKENNKTGKLAKEMVEWLGKIKKLQAIQEEIKLKFSEVKNIHDSKQKKVFIQAAQKEEISQDIVEENVLNKSNHIHFSFGEGFLERKKSDANLEIKNERFSGTKELYNYESSEEGDWYDYHIKREESYQYPKEQQNIFEEKIIPIKRPKIINFDVITNGKLSKFEEIYSSPSYVVTCDIAINLNCDMMSSIGEAIESRGIQHHCKNGVQHLGDNLIEFKDSSSNRIYGKYKTFDDVTFIIFLKEGKKDSQKIDIERLRKTPIEIEYKDGKPGNLVTKTESIKMERGQYKEC